MKEFKLPIVIVLCMLFILPAAYAQDNESEGRKGEKNIELQLRAPFPTFNVDGLRFRYFVSDDIALRLHMNVSLNYDTDEYLDEDNNNNLIKLSSVDQRFLMSINPGIQFNVYKSGKFSSYFGGDIRFSVQRASYTHEYLGENDRQVELKVTHGTHPDFTTTSPTHISYTGMGLGLVSGFDYRIFGGFYIGVEVGYGFDYITRKDVNVSGHEIAAADFDPLPQGSAFDLQPNAEAGLRVGFIF